MLTRRFFLQGAIVAGCSAAHPLTSTVTFASAPGTRRLVVIILRGGMDGLDIVQPYGDPALKLLRPDFPVGPQAGAADLDGFFALHPHLVPKLLPMWTAGELAFAHAVSTPYRDKRSHFDGQDMLEAGTGMDVPGAMIRDGWLNRLLQTLPGATAETAYSVGEEELRLLSGTALTMSWRPNAWLGLSSQGRRLLESIYHDDPLFRDAAADALAITASETADADMEGAESGAARIAAFSLTGWDTHRGQVAALRRPATRLAAMLRTLKTDLGPIWGETLVLAMTEFGRTARQNGTAGTDHGTGGALVMAGGALKGGKVDGRGWPRPTFMPGAT